jgi:hypothetical protein
MADPLWDTDEETTLMISVLSHFKIQHRVVFEGVKPANCTQIYYKCSLEVKPTTHGEPWFHAESLEELLAWLSKGK